MVCLSRVCVCARVFALSLSLSSGVYKARCVRACMKEVYILSIYAFEIPIFYLFLFFSSLPIRERRKALSLRGVLRCPSRRPTPQKRRDDDAVVFRRKGRIIIIVSSIARARFSRKSARRAVAWSSFGGVVVVVVFFVRVFYLSLFAMVSRPHPTKKRERGLSVRVRTPHHRFL